MNNLPYFPFYPADWLADDKVQIMSMAGEGCYTRLLCYQWREGSIPADRSAIVLLCKGYDGPGIDEALERFTPADNRTSMKGRLINRRLLEERQKQEEYRNLKKIAGLHGAETRWHSHDSAIGRKNSTPIVLPLAKNGSSSSSSIKNKSRDLSLVDIELTQSLIDGILGNNPEAAVIKRLTDKRKEEWINQCRLLREADGRTPEHILAVIQFSQADDFWKTNILSMPKLREKWDQLWLKAQAAGKGSGYKRDEGARYVKPTPAEEIAEVKLMEEYLAAQKKFMEAKGYKSEEAIPFDEYETFDMFKARIKRKRR